MHSHHSHHHLFPTAAPSATMSCGSSSSIKVSPSKPKSHSNNADSKPSSSSSCRHSRSAILDILIMVVVLFSGTFLISSYFSYINSLSLLLLHNYHYLLSFPYLLTFLIFFFILATAALSIELRGGLCSSRRCQRAGCMGLKNAAELDLKIQTEEDVVRCSSGGDGGGEIEELPWKGGSEGKSDYECLRAKLTKMAPPNGRAVLLIRAPCGCTVAKLEGWGPKKRKRHKRSQLNATLNGVGGDNR